LQKGNAKKQKYAIYARKVSLVYAYWRSVKGENESLAEKLAKSE